MKTVIFKTLKGYATTNEENYNARIRNERRVMDCSRFDTPEEIIEYYCKYFGATEEEFIVKA